MNHFEIQELPGKGRAMIASKNFAVGEIIFEEEPFVSHQFSWNAAYGYAACDHCMRPVRKWQDMAIIYTHPTLNLARDTGGECAASC